MKTQIARTIQPGDPPLLVFIISASTSCGAILAQATFAVQIKCALNLDSSKIDVLGGQRRHKVKASPGVPLILSVPSTKVRSSVPLWTDIPCDLRHSLRNKALLGSRLVKYESYRPGSHWCGVSAKRPYRCEESSHRREWANRSCKWAKNLPVSRNCGKTSTSTSRKPLSRDTNNPIELYAWNVSQFQATKGKEIIEGRMVHTHSSGWMMGEVDNE